MIKGKGGSGQTDLTGFLPAKGDCHLLGRRWGRVGNLLRYPVVGQEGGGFWLT